MTGEGTQSSGGDTPPIFIPTALRAATRTIQLVLVGIVLYVAAAGATGLLVNSLVMLAIAVLPDVVRYRYDVRAQPVVSLLIAAAPFLHAVGAIGPYRTVPLFDQLAHAVSAMLIAGLGYVIVQLIDTEREDITVPPNLKFVFVVIFATSIGVAWECLEFGTGLLSAVTGGEALLAQYGPSDIVLDLLFNTVGALVVALWGTRYFEGLRGFLARRLSVGP